MSNVIVTFFDLDEKLASTDKPTETLFELLLPRPPMAGERVFYESKIYVVEAVDWLCGKDLKYGVYVGVKEVGAKPKIRLKESKATKTKKEQAK